MANSYIPKVITPVTGLSGYIWSSEGGSKYVSFSGDITNTNFVVIALRLGNDIRASSIMPTDEFVSGSTVQVVMNVTGTIMYGQAVYVNSSTVSLSIANPDNAWVNNCYIRFM